MNTNENLSPDSPHFQSILGTARFYFGLARENPEKSQTFFHKAIHKVLDDYAEALPLQVAETYLYGATLLSDQPNLKDIRDECLRRCKSVLDFLPVNAYLEDPTMVNDASFDPLAVGRLYGDLSTAYFHVGNLDDAGVCMDLAIHLFVKCGERESRELSAFISWRKGQILLQNDDFNGALMAYCNAVATSTHTTSKLVTMFHELTSTDFTQGDYDQKIKRRCRMTATLLIHRLFRNATEPLEVGRVHCVWGIAYFKIGKLDDARAHMEKAIQCFEEHAPNSQDSWHSHHAMAGIMVQRKAFDVAALHFQRAIKIAKSTKSMSDLAATYRDMALAFHNQGEYDQALGFTLSAIKIQERHCASVPRKLARSYKLLGSIYGSHGESHQAAKCYQKVIEHSEGSGHLKFELSQRLGLVAALAKRH